jgi:hypothetical protein
MNRIQPISSSQTASACATTLDGQISISHSLSSSVEKTILLSGCRCLPESGNGNNHSTSFLPPGIGLRKSSARLAFVLYVVSYSSQLTILVLVSKLPGRLFFTPLRDSFFPSKICQNANDPPYPHPVSISHSNLRQRTCVSTPSRLYPIYPTSLSPNRRCRSPCPPTQLRFGLRLLFPNTNLVTTTPSTT